MRKTVLKEYHRLFNLLIHHIQSHLNGFENLSIENLISKMMSKVENPQQHPQIKMLFSNENVEKLKVIKTTNNITYRSIHKTLNIGSTAQIKSLNENLKVGKLL